MQNPKRLKRSDVSESFTYNYDLRREYVVNAIQKEGFTPGFAVLELLMFFGMTHLQAEVSVMIHDGCIDREIIEYYEGKGMRGAKAAIARLIGYYGSKAELSRFVAMVDMIIRWSKECGGEGRWTADDGPSSE